MANDEMDWTELWSYTVGEPVNGLSGTPEGKPFVLFQGQEQVQAFRVKDKIKPVFLWKFSTSNFISHSSVSKNTGKVNVVTEEGLYSLNSSGVQRWKFLFEGDIKHNLSFSNDNLLIGTREGKLISIGADGKEIWTKDFKQQLTGLFITEEDTILVLLKKGIIILLDANSKELWSVEIKTGIHCGFYGKESTNAIIADSANEIFQVSNKGKISKFPKVLDSDPISCCWDEDNTTFLIGTKKGSIFGFSQKEKPKLIQQYSDGINDIISIPGHGFLVTVGDFQLNLISLKGDVIWEYASHKWITRVSFIRHPFQILVCSTDATVKSFGTKELKEDVEEPSQKEGKIPLPIPKKPKPSPKKKEPFEPMTLPKVEENAICSKIYEYVVVNKDMVIPREDLENMYFSLKSQNFVILAGKPGLGKTKLALEYMNAFRQEIFSDDVVSSVFIPVTMQFDESDLLGYINLKDEYVPSQLMKTIFFHKGQLKDVAELVEDETIYFVILDEMNLSSPDQYLSRFISCIESSAPLAIPSSGGEGVVIRPLPPNIFIIGTINSYMEESTRTKLSGGIKRRANIIFTKNPLDEIFSLTDLDEQRMKMFDDLKKLYNQVMKSNTTRSLMGRFKENDFKEMEETELNDIFESLYDIMAVLAPVDGIDITYGIIQDILEYTIFSNIFEIDMALDFQILQKIIPHLAGDVAIISKILNVNDFQVRFPYSSKVLHEMERRASENMNIIIHQV